MNDIAVAPPIACTLDRGSFKDRIAWIAALNARSLTSSRRSDLALTLEYGPASLDDIRELVRGEQACCAFLDFDLDERADKLILTITAPEIARDAADMLFEQFEAKSAAAVSSCGCAPGCAA
ncbi:conserved hypothetical protein [Mesorhizobium metallidurans STM 2683]|uniref:Uncharacterized protein n=1 Tax=Mesorhizobium metallidurans STM 2683 TaxID=1297569 RepID=M5ELZ5_9HYPH|nr:hypothetical protein [Mesorhizobium metallidurans]CCV05764.1 conserved hypothetical protein [Mesorhizobium metallidurans STM 2683]